MGLVLWWIAQAAIVVLAFFSPVFLFSRTEFVFPEQLSIPPGLSELLPGIRVMVVWAGSWFLMSAALSLLVAAGRWMAGKIR